MTSKSKKIVKATFAIAIISSAIAITSIPAKAGPGFTFGTRGVSGLDLGSSR